MHTFKSPTLHDPCKARKFASFKSSSLRSRVANRIRGNATPGPDEGPAKKEEGETQWKLPASGSDTDWREFRARLIRGEQASPPATASQPANEADAPGQSDEEMWAHPISAPERGCLLLAHPLMFQSNQVYFHQSVILITSHDENGTTGVILNKPLEHLIGQLSGMDPLRPEFSDNRLFLGGDVGRGPGGNAMQLLHTSPALAGSSMEVVKGVYLGGFQQVKLAVRREEIDPVKSCRWYCQYSGWAPGQLQQEVKQGVWFTAAASKDMIFHPSCLENGSRHWHSVLRGMGGDFKRLSDEILADPEAREAVWGKNSFTKSVQGGEPTKPEEEEQP